MVTRKGLFMKASIYVFIFFTFLCMYIYADHLGRWLCVYHRPVLSLAAIVEKEEKSNFVFLTARMYAILGGERLNVSL